MMTRDLLVFSGAAGIFAIYLRTLSPNVAGGDSGELLAEGCMLGTAHPPGYPLFTLMTFALYTSFPQYNAAYLVNVSSALLTALAAFFMGKVMIDFYKSSISAALFAMGMFSFSPLIWQYAVTAEVFPINTFFSAYIVYLVCKFSMTKSIYVAIWGAFICGLALTNQHTIILFEIPLILWMMWLLRFKLFKNNWALCYKIGVAFLVGIMPYAYMPIAASISPKPGSWGHVTTLSGFLHHFLRKDYGTFQLFSGASGKTTESMLVRNIAFIKDVYHHQGFYVVPFLALFAIIACFMKYFNNRSNNSNNSVSNNSSSNRGGGVSKSDGTNADNKKKEIVASSAPTVSAIDESTTIDSDSAHTPLILVITLFFYFFVFHSLSNLPLYDKLLYGVHQRFWMQPGVIFFMLGGLGFDYVIDLLNYKKSKSTWVEPLISIIKMVAALCIVAAHFNKNLFLSDQHDAYHFKNYASAILSPLPENAVLLVNYDMQWTSIRYLQKCENFRNDVTAINLSMMTYNWFQHKRDLYPNITFPGKFHCNSETSKNSKSVQQQKQCFSMFAFVEDNIDKLDIFLSGKLSYQDQLLSQKYDWMPFGLVSKVVLKSSLPTSVSYSNLGDSSWAFVNRMLPELPDVTKYPEETWEWTIGRDFKDRVGETAAYRLELAIAYEKEVIQPLIDAMYWIEVAVLLDGNTVLTSVLKNAGLAHIHLIQNPLLTSEKSLAMPTVDFFNVTEALKWPAAADETWKLWCSTKFLRYWGLFLERPDAKDDSQYGTIKAMHQKASEILMPHVVADRDDNSIGSININRNSNSNGNSPKASQSVSNDGEEDSLFFGGQQDSKKPNKRSRKRSTSK